MPLQQGCIPSEQVCRREGAAVGCLRHVWGQASTGEVKLCAWCRAEGAAGRVHAVGGPSPITPAWALPRCLLPSLGLVEMPIKDLVQVPTIRQEQKYPARCLGQRLLLILCWHGGGAAPLYGHKSILVPLRSELEAGSLRGLSPLEGPGAARCCVSASAGGWLARGKLFLQTYGSVAQLCLRKTGFHKSLSF